MSSPNAQLMDLYGTDEYYLEKCGAIPPGALKALQVIAPAAFLMSEQRERRNQKKLLAEAEMMNQMFRQAEHERMSPIMESLGLPPKQASAEAIELAESIGRKMVYGFEKTARDSAFEKLAAGASIEELTEMEKQAIGFLGGIAKALGGAAKAIGRGAGKATTGLASKATNIGGARKGILSKILPKRMQSGLGTAGLKMERAGERLTRASTPVVGRSQTATQIIKKAPTSTVYRGGLPPLKTVSSGAAGAPKKVRQVLKAPSKKVPGTAAAAAPAGKKKPLIGWGTKAKIGLGAGALGLGYVGLKGAQTVRDYMMLPSYATRYGQYGPAPPTSVSQYGYAAPRF